jgi:hypothetical protein
MSGVAGLFLFFDAAAKLLAVQSAVEATVRLGYPPNIVHGLGLLEAACLIIYSIPQTSVLGAVLWTGYLGGAVASHLRVASPLFSHTLFPVYIAALLWTGLGLRNRLSQHGHSVIAPAPIGTTPPNASGRVP